MSDVDSGRSDAAEPDMLQQMLNVPVQATSGNGLELATRLETMSLFDALGRSFGYNDNDMFDMPFIAPLVILQAAACETMGQYGRALKEERENYKNMCNSCPLSHIQIIDTGKQNTVGIQKQRRVASMVNEVGASEEQQREEAEEGYHSDSTESTNSMDSIEATSSKTKGKKTTNRNTAANDTMISVPCCQIPGYLLAAVYRTCSSESGNLPQLVESMSIVVSASSRLLKHCGDMLKAASQQTKAAGESCPQPKRTKTRNGETFVESMHRKAPSSTAAAKINVTPMEEEYIFLELAMKMVICRFFEPPETEQQKQCYVRSILDLFKAWSPVSGWLECSDLIGHKMFSKNPEMFNTVEKYCALYHDYKNRRLQSEKVLDFFECLHACVRLAITQIPKKRTRTTRVSVYNYFALGSGDAVKHACMAACHFSASEMSKVVDHERYISTMSSDRECDGELEYENDREENTDKLLERTVAYVMPSKAIEDVMSFVFQSREWEKKMSNDGSAQRNHGSAKRTSPACLAAPAQMRETEDNRKIYVYQSGDNCILLSKFGVLERLRKVMMCTMWIGDKIPNSTDKFSEGFSPFPKIMELLVDPDPVVVMHAYSVLCRAVTKNERRPSTYLMKPDTANHLRLLGPTLHAIFGNDIDVIMQSIKAMWCMPTPCFIQEKGTVSKMRLKPHVCLKGEYSSSEYATSRVLVNDGYAVHGNLVFGIVSYSTPHNTLCDNVTLSKLTEYFADRHHAEMRVKYKHLCEWLCCSTDDEVAIKNNYTANQLPLNHVMYDVDVPVPGIRLVYDLYAFCRDEGVADAKSLKLALFCNLHPIGSYIDFHAPWKRNWTFPNSEDRNKEVYDTCDREYALRAVVLFLLQGSTRQLKTVDHNVPVLDRYSLKTMSDIYVPHTNESAKIITPSTWDVVPLSHSKDQFVPYLPDHECILMYSSSADFNRLPRALNKSDEHKKEWALAPFSKNILGKYVVTDTSSVCRWCLEPETAENAMLTSVGCQCKGTKLAASHISCLSALGILSDTSPRYCTACGDVGFRNTCVTLDYNGKTGRLGPGECVLVPRRCLFEKREPTVCCSTCYVEGRRVAFAFASAPLNSRVDFCSEACMDCFKKSCACCTALSDVRVFFYVVEEDASDQLKETLRLDTQRRLSGRCRPETSAANDVAPEEGKHKEIFEVLMYSTVKSCSSNV